MPGTLFVVATPIGNLEDITLRALRVLREVDLIAAEDTRHTGKLLAHFSISTPRLSFHAHNTQTRLPQIVGRLLSGASVALVTDAGTPGVSDPGVELVQACIAADILVDPLPGPSAPLVAAIGSGFPLQPLTVYGFAPSRPKELKAWLEAVAQTPGTVTFFEAPHRIRNTLHSLADILGNRPIAVGRELTKLHQEFIRGSAIDIVGRLTTARGEFTVVVGPSAGLESRGQPVTDEDVLAEFGRVTDSGPASRREAIALVARRLSKPPKEVYAAVERAKKSGL